MRLAVARGWCSRRRRLGLGVVLESRRSAADGSECFAPPASGHQLPFRRNGEGGFALSPDGTRLAFVGRTQGKAHLWLRTLAESESRLLPDSEDAYNPFWSPDSRWIGFFTPLKLKKIEVASGSVVDVLERPGSNLIGSWSSRGVIIYANPNAIRGGNPPNPVLKIPDTGGTPVPIPETLHASSPSFLPDGRRFTFFRGDAQEHDLWLASIDADEKPRNLGDFGTHPSYSQGHILSVVNGVLMARPFDLAQGEFSGDSFRLKAPLANRVLFGYLFTNYSANAQGMLVYPPAANVLSELRWRDRTGKQLGTLGPPGEYYTPRISPDGKRVAFSRRDGNNSDIWVADLSTGSFTRLTFDPAIDENPVWSPDGATVTFDNDASGAASLYRKAATGAGGIDRLTTRRVRTGAARLVARRAVPGLHADHPQFGDHDPGRRRRPAAQLPGARARSLQSPVQSGRAAALDCLRLRRQRPARDLRSGIRARQACFLGALADFRCRRNHAAMARGRQRDFLLVPGGQDDGRSSFDRAAASSNPRRPNSCSTRVRLSCAPRISNMTSRRMASVS